MKLWKVGFINMPIEAIGTFDWDPPDRPWNAVGRGYNAIFAQHEKKEKRADFPVPQPSSPTRWKTLSTKGSKFSARIRPARKEAHGREEGRRQGADYTGRGSRRSHVLGPSRACLVGLSQMCLSLPSAYLWIQPSTASLFCIFWISKVKHEY